MKECETHDALLDVQKTQETTESSGGDDSTKRHLMTGYQKF